MRLAMIADDLTGANDSGVQLARFGLHTSVLFHPDEEALGKNEAVVLDTDSRSLPPDEAYQKVKEASQLIKEKKFDVIFKKIDSTLRGNLGTEIDAIYDVFQPDLVVIAPAYPKNGRQTMDGIHYLNQQKVSETEIAKDPKTPVRESYIPTLLEGQTKHRVGLITLEDLDIGLDAVLTKLQDLKQQGISYVVFDAKEEDDLRRLAGFVLQSNYSVCWVGSAGLANHLPDIYGLQMKKQVVEIPRDGKPVLLVVGSVSGVSRKQLDLVLEQPGIKGIAVQSSAVVSSSEDKRVEIGKAYDQAVNDLNASARCLAIYSSGTPEDIRQAQQVGKQHGFDEREVSNLISQALGEVAAKLLEVFQIKGLVLTGGDTAKQVCNQLGITGFKLIDEVEIGIPLGKTVGKRELYAITKAGAFGTERSLLHSIKKLQGEDIQ
ncbi:four-carbon acid sugar kinase family protein [Ammoniphilus resinae]|uniref:Uncharacterized protein YgbK (DUF1537 family) n=1 Tax=Ammoniphilus resinae TaxID=861532 RepID=A0ABS4GVR8_9BACL|nr:four-carbon acid sugar kinase family protein [Ammoniphilus resinae]MBP1934366.1 uncharacterized protein YgbK (DUF1537 family) [Ammoniphilus resinae]